VIVGLVTIVGLVYWWVPGGARKTYRGPVEEVVVTDAEHDHAAGGERSERYEMGEQSQEINEVKE
jgi:hypothetical protein